MNGVGVGTSVKDYFQCTLVQSSTCTHVVALKFRRLTSPQHAEGAAFLRGKKRYKLVSATISKISPFVISSACCVLAVLCFLPRYATSWEWLLQSFPSRGVSVSTTLSHLQKHSVLFTSLFVVIDVQGSESGLLALWRQWYLPLRPGVLYQSMIKASFNCIHINQHFAYGQLYTTDR